MTEQFGNKSTEELSGIIKFYPEFKPIILSGQKRTTIRRDTDCIIGEERSLVTTTGENISNAVITYVSHFNMNKSSFFAGNLFRHNQELHISEGFKSAPDLWEFLKSHYGLMFHETFEGKIIQWKLLND